MLTLKENGIEYSEQGFSSFLDFSKIITLEWGTEILKGLLKIYHEKRMYIVNFNCSRNDLVVPFIESFRNKKGVSFAEHETPFYHCPDLEFLIKQNLKFFNIAGDTLNKEDKIIKYFFQHSFVPSDKQIPFFAKYYSPYLVIELEKEWIILKEDKQKVTKTGTYGWARQYIHKDMIENIETEPRFLTFTLKGSYQFKYPLSSDNLNKAAELIK
jgi:hypothetical protein